MEQWPNGSCFKGSYVNGKKAGQGHLTSSEYTGEWLDNQMHGKGEYKWSDGRKYVGQYVQDQKEGYGEMEWPDGRKYKGYYKDGKQEGIGIYINSQGETKYGVWQQGKRLEWLEEAQYNERKA